MSAVHHVNSGPSHGISKTQGHKGPHKAKKSASQSYANAAARTPSLHDAANVQISPKAREMNLARQAVEHAPDVHESRIQELREKIRNGTYKPSSEKTAKAMLHEAFRDEVAQNS